MVAGHRRLESARKLGLKTMVCSVKQVDDKKAAKLHFGENEDRANLSPIERGRFFETFLKKFGLRERREKNLACPILRSARAWGLRRFQERWLGA